MKGYGSVSDWTTLFRLGNNLTGVFGVLLGSIVALGTMPEGILAQLTVLHASSVLFFMCSWNALNDIYDFDIDIKNRPNRPLPSGRISLRAAKIATILTMLSSVTSIILCYWLILDADLGVGFSLTDWYPSLAIWVIALLLLINYEFPFGLRLKDRGLPGNIAISISVGLVVVFGSAAVFQPFNEKAWSLFFVGIFYNISREIIKDVEDMDGDEGRNTLAMRIGPENARTVAWVMSILALTSVIIPFAIGIFPPLHVVLVIPAVMTLMMVKGRIILGEDKSASSLLKKSMLLCLGALLTSSLI
ncbi:MAG: geranylgeranylglycerol-phosphate geranylgeranyltransferase [Candidatus Thalassarchaeaceae archaeon]|nr:geranylgeranylglycerol-phosphate geranylgeranyltransferase [Candidatus Thalassarchaeaceae archaeon]